MLEGHKGLGKALQMTTGEHLTRCPQGSASSMLFPYWLEICSSLVWAGVSFCRGCCQRTYQCVLIACLHDCLGGGPSLNPCARHTHGHIIYHRHPECASWMNESINKFHFNSFSSICFRILQTEKSHVLKQCDTYVFVKSQPRCSVRKSN